jgi:membrane associated rhomboid family serine protease
MLILGDESKSNGKIPWVTFSLIVLNIGAFCVQRCAGESLTFGFALIPKEISTLTDLTKSEHVKAKVPGRIRLPNGQAQTYYREVWVTVPQAPGPFPIVLTLITSMFLHGGWMHLIGNMWFLAVFGRNVEYALDHGRFLLFYVFCGVVGGLVYTVTKPWSVIPCVGASGAISGVLGAYIAIHPLNPISVWFGFFYWVYIGVIKVPAIFVVGSWFLFQYVGAFESLEFNGTSVGGTAYWAHMGGFLAGIATVWATVGYLKWKMANAPPDEEETLAAEHQEHAIASDPFSAFLPRNTATNSMAKSPTCENADPGPEKNKWQDSYSD